LHKIISSGQYLGDEHIQFLLYQMLCATNFMHSAHVLHRDLKPANLLLNGDCTLKICDLGLARAVDLMHEMINEAAEVKQSEPTTQPASQPTHPKDKPAALNNATRTSTLPNEVKPAESMPDRSRLRRLSKHVVTRWYRCPELLTLSDRYDDRIDSWSIACIFAEMLRTKAPTQGRQAATRGALFPGDSCYGFTNNNPHNLDNENNQLNLIYNLLGTPSDSDLASINNSLYQDYIKSLPRRQPKNLQSEFPEASPLALDLLKKMLCWNPLQRYSVQDALDHPYLEDIANAYSEPKELRYPLPPAYKILTAEDKQSLREYYQFETDSLNIITAFRQEIALYTKARNPNVTAATTVTTLEIQQEPTLVTSAIQPGTSGQSTTAQSGQRSLSENGLPSVSPVTSAIIDMAIEMYTFTPITSEEKPVNTPRNPVSIFHNLRADYFLRFFSAERRDTPSDRTPTPDPDDGNQRDSYDYAEISNESVYSSSEEDNAHEKQYLNWENERRHSF
jgi:mitogen-activated protein kinase 1/3